MAFDILSPSAQVAQHLKKLILKGHWDKQLPGTPALSGETGIDRKTITAAIQLLEAEGIVEITRGPTGRGRLSCLTNCGRGISVPEEVSLFCTDDDLVFEMCDPDVSCIRWPADPVVQHIVKWVRQVSRGKVTRTQKYTPATIVVGGTIGPVPGTVARQ